MTYLYSYILLPQNYIAEEILLGSIIINPSLLGFVTQYINTEHFFLEGHKVIYRNLITIEKRHKNYIDPVNLAYSLQEKHILNRIGGISLITELIKQGQVFNSSNNIYFYVKQIIFIIHNNYKRRLLIQYGFNIIKLAYRNELSSHLLYSKASEYLNYIYRQTSFKNLDNLNDLIGLLIFNLQQSRNHISRHQHLYSGFKELDIVTNGLPAGDLIVIAGRPSMGKTSLVINIAHHLIQYYYAQVCIFSLEMTKLQILYKLISVGSGIKVKNIEEKNINNKEWEKIQRICNSLIAAKVYINDNSSISINEIQYISEIMLRKEADKQTIIIDYLQLLHEKNSNSENRNQELSYITRQLKILAQSFKIPILILSQLNRSVDKRLNKQPLLSDLKESGCISFQTYLDYQNINRLTIKTIISIEKNVKLPYFHSSRYFYKKKQNNYVYNLYILKQYTFLCNTGNDKIIRIAMTDNHHSLNYYYWTRQKKVKKNLVLIKSYHYSESPSISEKTYINTIIFYNHNIVYDLSKYIYVNLVCTTIILHNSIEQDADIVMMLYEEYNTKNNKDITKKLIDITISKNRNGPTGSFKLQFHSETTKFTNTNDNYLFSLKSFNN